MAAVRTRRHAVRTRRRGGGGAQPHGGQYGMQSFKTVLISRAKRPNPQLGGAAQQQIAASYRIPWWPDPTCAMASPADSVKEVAAAAAAASASEASAEAKEKETRKGGGILWRIWRALSGGRGEGYETRLQYLSKEEAAVHARMRRRMQFSRRSVRNLIVLSVLGEVGAVVYAIITPKSEDLEWQMRAIRVLPMLDLPALSSMIYSILLSFTRMLERKDQKSLERLRAERNILPNSLVIG